MPNSEVVLPELSKDCSGSWGSSRFVRWHQVSQERENQLLAALTREQSLIAEVESLRSELAACKRDEWVSVEKAAKPDNWQEVLMRYAGDTIIGTRGIYAFAKEAAWSGYGQEDFDQRYVTHWMPLPAPPKEDR